MRFSRRGQNKWKNTPGVQRKNGFQSYQQIGGPQSEEVIKWKKSQTLQGCGGNELQAGRVKQEHCPEARGRGNGEEALITMQQSNTTG